MPPAGARRSRVPPSPPRQSRAKSYRAAPRVPWICRPLPMKDPQQRFKTIAFVASSTPEARDAYDRLEKRYGNCDPKSADVIVALGGDGLMLQTLHKFMTSGKPIYGMHRGTVGFLMNDYAAEHLHERLAAAQLTVIHPLLMCAKDQSGKSHEHHAINEVSLFRQSAQAAHLRIKVDEQERMPELIADGV